MLPVLLSMTIFVITVVKMLWTPKAPQPHLICILLQYQRQRKLILKAEKGIA